MINSNEISFREVVFYLLLLPILTIVGFVFAANIGLSRYNQPVKCKGYRYVWVDKAKSSEQLAERWFTYKNPSVVAPQIDRLNKPGWQLRDSVKIPNHC